MGRTGIIWSNRFTEFFFSPKDLWPVWLRRMRRFKELIDDTSLSSFIDIIEASHCSDDVLLLAHSKDYVEYLKDSSRRGFGVLDYGDTIVYEGILDDVLLIVGSAIKGLKLLMDGEYEVIYQPFGGLHHARRDAAAGFCPVNDIAITIEYARKYYGVDRVAVVDIDVHHGDGTQQIFYRDPSVLTISLHMRAPYFYPGTGDVDEVGEGEGRGYSINVPLPPGTGDEGYRLAFSSVVPKALSRYRPKLLIAQLGVDGHKDDLLGGLRLTVNTYLYVTSLLKTLSMELRIPLLAFGGGGYGYRSSEAMIACVLGLIKDEIPSEGFTKVWNVIKEDETRDGKDIIESIESVLKMLKEVIEILR